MELMLSRINKSVLAFGTVLFHSSIPGSIANVAKMVYVFVFFFGFLWLALNG